MNAPLRFEVAVATCTHCAGEGEVELLERHRGRAEPLTVPVIVSPVPQMGRTVDGVIATPVGALPVVNVRSPPRVMPAALVATARKL